MKVAARRGIWRPLRCFVILVSVAGAILAADNSWMNSLPFDEFQFDDWFASMTRAESREAKSALPDESAKVPELQTSISRWTDRSIFRQPASGWTLDAARSATMPLSKTDFASAWLTQRSDGFVAPSSRFDYSLPGFFASGSITRMDSTAPAAPAATTGTTGYWSSNASGTWSTPANWVGANVASGAGATAHFDALDLTNNVTVTLNTSRTIGNVHVGDTNGTHSYTFIPSVGSVLTFDNGTTDTSFSSLLQQTATSAGDTVAVPIQMKNYLDINNLSTTQPFTISGDIAPASGKSVNVQFNHVDTSVTPAGNINVTGNLTNPSSVLGVVVNGGTVTFTGTNTYSGGTEVNGGTLLINGDNSGATGAVTVFFSGSVLGGTGIMGGTVSTYGGTITGGTTTTVGALTLTGNVNINTGEGGGTYLANLSGNTSDLLAIAQKLTLGLDTTLSIVGTADGVTTYILATFSSHDNVFGTVTGIPSGYSLVYNPTDIELVPTAIPEPATWIGGALALGALALTQKRRLRARP